MKVVVLKMLEALCCFVVVLTYKIRSKTSLLCFDVYLAAACGYRTNDALNMEVKGLIINNPTEKYNLRGSTVYRSSGRQHLPRKRWAFVEKNCIVYYDQVSPSMCIYVATANLNAEKWKEEADHVIRLNRLLGEVASSRACLLLNNSITLHPSIII